MSKTPSVFRGRFAGVDADDQTASKEKENTVHFVIVYNFMGKKMRAGIGHSALWDGQRYYTYGAGYDYKHGITASPEFAEGYSKDEKKIYGDFVPVLLPTPLEKIGQTKQFSDKFYGMNVHDNYTWSRQKYNFLEKNCAQFVNYALKEMGFLESTNEVRSPSQLAYDAAKAGLAQLKKTIQTGKTLDHSKETISKMTSFLKQLNSNISTFEEDYKKNHRYKIALPTGIRDLKKLLENLEEKLKNTQDPKIISDLFYTVQKKLAEKHYSKVTRLTGAFLRHTETAQFYMDELKHSLDADPAYNLTLHQTLKETPKDTKETASTITPAPKESKTRTFFSFLNFFSKNSLESKEENTIKKDQSISLKK